MISRAPFFMAAFAASSMLIACASDTGKPSDGTTSGAPAPTGSTKAALIDGCVKDDDCTSGTCYLGDQGSYCSIKCTTETASKVCVAPLAGTCNKKGFCKKP